jgi:DNA-directed RNA polymerase beta subunit
MNAGLIASLAIHARMNTWGSLEAHVNVIEEATKQVVNKTSS